MARRRKFAIVVVATSLVTFCSLLSLQRISEDELSSKTDTPQASELGQQSNGNTRTTPLLPVVEIQQEEEVKAITESHAKTPPPVEDDPEMQEFLALPTPKFRSARNCSQYGERPDISLLKARKIYELRLDASIRELWSYAREEVKSQSGSSRNKLKQLKELYRVLRLDLDNIYNVGMESVFQTDWHCSQRNVSLELTQLMERRINYLQNPPNCTQAKKIVCHLEKTCGFGCQMHHVGYCFIMAYATERTLVLDSSNWRYSAEGWSAAFLPLSDTCVEARGNLVDWGNHSESTETVNLPIIDYFPKPYPAQLPMSIPRDLADRLLAFHGAPFAWFVGQFYKFLMRPSAHLEAYMREKEEKLGMSRPIVGVHIRRTDKNEEAAYHPVKDYMEQVEAWFDYYELSHGEGAVQRSVYIATDDPNVLAEAKQMYPQYVVHCDAQSSLLATNESYTRYSTESLYGVTFDVLTLSQCDYLVCTFSSQLCRLAYELMQNHHVDASGKFYSLDDHYYFGGQIQRKERVLMDQAGSVEGTHHHWNVRGLFPRYPARYNEDNLLVTDFPTYPNA